MIDRKTISWILIGTSTVALIITAIGIVKYNWNQGMVLVIFLASLCLLTIGLLFNITDSIENRTKASDIIEPSEKQKRQRIIEVAEQGVISMTSGIATATIFLLAFYWLDFGETGISEKNLDQLCPSYSIERKLINPDEPDLWLLFLEFLSFGAIVGIVIGFTLSPWKRILERLGKKFVSLSWVNSGSTPYVIFGLTWGFFLGGFMNILFFGNDDGRPFMKFSTSALAANVSILIYIWWVYVRYYKKFSEYSIYQLTITTAYALLCAFLIIIIDESLHLSESTYCFFYQAWDSKSNTLKVTKSIWLAAAGYGAYIGLLVSLIVGAYDKVRKSYSKRTNINSNSVH